MNDDPIGEKLDRYRIERLLGRGGMGAVYFGIDEETGRQVAIKVMSRSLGEDEDLVRRFDREAKLASRTDHPNIARVLGNGVSGDVRYLVMEFVDGQPLSEVIKTTGRVAGPKCLELIRQTAEGLKAAHESGIIHRDIKPENLMLTQDGTVKIVDFGLAKNENGDSFKTATGAVMGTPHYMSPEQATGRPVDHRSDIYSLGATFYHLLSGHTPFEGENAFTIIQKHISTDPPAITKWNPSAPEPVCQIVYRMMGKHPDDRFQTYQHLISVLNDVTHGRTERSMTMRVVDSPQSTVEEIDASPDRRKLLRIGAVVIALVIAGLGIHYIKNEFFWAPRATPTTELEKNQDIFELGQQGERMDLRRSTLPQLREIRRVIDETDEYARQSGSRRERDNAPFQ